MMQGPYGNTKTNTKKCDEFKHVTKNTTYETYFWLCHQHDKTKSEVINYNTQSDIKLNSNTGKQQTNKHETTNKN